MATAFQAVGVAPMRPVGPCFATPIFRTARSNSSWYQRITDEGNIESFDEVDEAVASNLKESDNFLTRSIGQPALFGYLTEDKKVLIGEKTSLAPALTLEYFRNKSRVHLRHALAKFLENQNLIRAALTEVESWRQSWRSRLDRTSRVASSQHTTSEQRAALRQTNQRPVSVEKLVTSGEFYPGWYAANKRLNRFHVVNLMHVMSLLGIEYTKTRPLFQQAQKIIQTETNWATEYDSDYYCSHTQISTHRAHGAKHFDHAVAIIVAMEVAAAELKTDLNVYDWLRILPAQFFVDRFNAKRLSELESHYANLSQRVRARTFKEGLKSGMRATSFEALCLSNLEQEHSHGLLLQMTEGFCVTRYTAERLVNFVNEHFPPGLHVGPVRSSGEDSFLRTVGTKAVASSLRVPKHLPPERLGLCR